MITFRGEHLGDVVFEPQRFSDEIGALHGLSTFEKHERLNRALFEAIRSSKHQFVLPQVIDFIARARAVLPTYHLTSFEFWLNQYAAISEEEKMAVRGKIVGKGIPRSEYQNFFPLPKGEPFFGSHYSCAHISPDLDTTTASFACFLAAFGARVGQGRHHWFLPGGPPKGSMEIEFCFTNALGKEVFSVLASTGPRLNLSALDFISQDVVRVKKDVMTYELDPAEKAVLLVNDKGALLGEWLARDVDPVRARTMRFRATLVEHQYEFVQEMVCHKEEWSAFVKRQLAKKIQPVIGPECTVGEFFKENRSFFGAWEEALQKQLPIEEVFSIGKAAFQGYFAYLDSLGMAIQIKEELLHRGPFGLSHLATYEEIVEAMQGKNFVTVHYEEHALGVIYAEDVHRRAVATSSWNDFSNSKETDAREEVEVISFIDHHKSDVRTARPAFGVVRADAQSSNSIVARISFDINDRYSTGGMTLEEIEKELKRATHPRIIQRLLQKKQAALTRGDHYIAVEREFLEYVQYIFAILDDTDLLTKVTEYDVDGMASLLNRLKSIMLKKEVEVIHFDDIPRGDADFAKKAARKLLRTADLYSLYGAVYRAKEEAIDQVIRTREEVSLFQDTKMMGKDGYAAVGQFKMFAKNAPTMEAQKRAIRKQWKERSLLLYKNRPEVFFHMFMISTLASAEELYADAVKKPGHQDELWFWVPQDKQAQHRLDLFIQHFSRGERVEEDGITILKVDAGSIKSRKTDVAIYL